MNKIFLKVGLGAAAILAGMKFASFNEQASAATWHSGTPAALRGSYQTKLKANGNSGWLAYRYVFTKSYAAREARMYQPKTKFKYGAPAGGLAESVKYEKVKSNLYKLKGTPFTGKHKTLYVHTYSKKRIKVSYTTSFSKSTYYYKVNKDTGLK